MMKLELQDDEIGRALAAAEASGELRAAPSFGKPMPEDLAWAETPLEFRLPFKILKNAGLAPPELALFHERARLREALASVTDEPSRQRAERLLGELEQKLALRLEGLRVHGTL